MATTLEEIIIAKKQDDLNRTLEYLKRATDRFEEQLEKIQVGLPDALKAPDVILALSDVSTAASDKILVYEQEKEIVK